MDRSNTYRAAFLAVMCAGNVALADTGAGCTTNSLATPSWFIQDFSYWKASNSSSPVSFRLLNRATNGSAEAACPDSAAKLGWARCSVKKDKADKSTSLDAFLQLNGSSAGLLINETWSCSDKTPDKPYDPVSLSLSLSLSGTR